MARITYRGNLGAAKFPLISSFMGRTVIVGGQDQNASKSLVLNDDSDKYKGEPQLYYCHNVMPTATGIQSVGYTQPVVPLPLETKFTEIVTLRDAATGVQVYFSLTSDGRSFVLPFGNPSWREINTIPGAAGTVVTAAYVNGQTYVYFSGVGCYRYDSASDLMVAVVLTGLTAADVIGVCGASGYLIAWESNAVAWSSTADPTDFTPSIITGAGGGGVEQVKGNIAICSSHQQGFMIYTNENTVAAAYSGNARYPFNYRELVGSGGVGSLKTITYGSDSGNQYVYSTSGLQLMSMTACQTVMPEVTDFIAGKYFEDFDETTNTFSYQVLTSPMQKAITVVADRYLVISYGVTALTHAIVYDLVMKRLGKVKITHVAAFEWKLLSPELIETPRESLAFLKADSSIQIVDFSYSGSSSSGVALLGKYQYIRARMMTLDEVCLENFYTGGTFELLNSCSIDGKSQYSLVDGYLALDVAGQKVYNFDQTGTNHTLICKGSFHMDSIVLGFHTQGRT